MHRFTVWIQSLMNMVLFYATPALVITYLCYHSLFFFQFQSIFSTAQRSISVLGLHLRLSADSVTRRRLKRRVRLFPFSFSLSPLAPYLPSPRLSPTRHADRCPFCVWFCWQFLSLCFISTVFSHCGNFWLFPLQYYKVLTSLCKGPRYNACYSLAPHQ